MSPTYHAPISQTHTCNRDREAHLPGLACMEDNLVIHLLLHMDADTLLTVGRTSNRLYKLVCKMVVWRWLLKGIKDFTAERLQELRVFVKKAKSEEMGQDSGPISSLLLQEVLREAAHRLVKEKEVGDKLISLSVSIPGWGKPYILRFAPVRFGITLRHRYKIIKLQGPWLLKELSAMAEALSAKFSIIHMDVGILLDVSLDIVHIPEEIMQLLRRRIESQEEETSFNISSICFFETTLGSTVLSKFLPKFVRRRFCNKRMDPFSMEKCKEWTAESLYLGTCTGLDIYTPLLFKLDNVGHLQLSLNYQLVGTENLDVFKQVWMKAVKFSCASRARVGSLSTGGGRGGNPETDWQQILDYLTT